MKTRIFQKLRLTLVALTVLALAAGNALAQNSTTSTSTTAAQPATASQTAPQLSYGVPEVVQLSKAKVGDGTIINYIRNSGNNYGLNASQIIYLRQQGVSSAVINAMLNQPRTLSGQTAQTAPTTPAPQPASSTVSIAPTATVITQPAVTQVETVPASSVYIIPDTQTYRYNTWLYNHSPYYYYGYYPASYWRYPAMSVSFGWRGGWVGYRGGYHSSWHSSGFHGGFHGRSFHGGGWHHR